jgi:prepilin-type N-terminal cleavage/methylation domain-containing protein
MRKRAGVTLIEVLVSATIMSLVMTAVLSFYIEAVAVSSKRDEQSARLRRFHIGLDKMEQALREGRVVDVRARSILFLKLAEGSEQDGFPLYDPEAAQLASTEKGVVLTQQGEEKLILPTQEGEHVLFFWIPENPQGEIKKTALNIALYYSGMGERSDLFFHRTVNVQTY